MQPGAPKDKHMSLKRLYPGLDEQQYRRLDSWYARYAALLLRIHERLASDPEAHARFAALTSQSHRPTMSGKVDSKKKQYET